MSNYIIIVNLLLVFVQTRSMSLAGMDFLSTTTSLATVNAPMLQELDLSFATSLNDSAVYKLLSAPRDSRPGNNLHLHEHTPWIFQL